MQQLNRAWTVYIVHHSHTDIGYTDYQEQIEDQHVEYIRQVLSILRQPQKADFRWVCEGLWGVERFWERATAREREQFIREVQAGRIGLSGNYLNMTEAIAESVWQDTLTQAHDFCRSLGLRATCAMSADIDGYSWGFADSLAQQGVSALLSLIHTHHGRTAPGGPQTGFWWEGPQGNRVLAWVGEHYHMGNKIGLCPAYGVSLEDDLVETERLLPGYLARLENEGYPFSFCPMAVSGVLTDNAPPNGDIPLLTQAWNQRYGDRIRLQMATLEEFFEAVREHGDQLPVYRGDWTDWWADGIASTPRSLKLFREAQRLYRLTGQLDPQGIWIDDQLKRAAAADLVRYAEHTWGYHSSVNEPWNGMVYALEARKAAYATQAHSAVSRNLEHILRGKGKQTKRREASSRYKVCNPYDTALTDFIWLPKAFDYEQDLRPLVLDAISGEAIPCEPAGADFPGMAAGLLITLQPHEDRQLVVSRGGEAPLERTTTSDWMVSAETVETPFYTLRFSKEAGGLVSLIEKESGQELIRQDAPQPAFSPLYEVTPVTGGEYLQVRGEMKQQRRCLETRQTQGRLIRIEVRRQEILTGRIRLEYELPGTSLFEVWITVYRGQPRVDVAIRMNKDSVWEPENLYVALPFTREEDTFWVEKTAAFLRPGMDQIPNSCIDFYSIQEGMAFLSPQTGIAVACPDTPLIWMGKPEPISRIYEGWAEHNRLPVYSWVMNNFWETNFKASLGGFYECRYYLTSGSHLKTPQAALRACQKMNTGAVVFRCREER